MAEGNKAVYAALAANAIVAVSKFVVGIGAGSSTLIAEGFHSLADTGDGALLLLGERRAKKPPDPTHPFGHGKELYFWTLVVAVSIFGIGGVASVIEGVTHVRHPEHLTKSPVPTYIVLAAAGLIEGASMAYAWYQFLKEKGKGRSIREAVRDAKDPTTFMVVFEDTAAVIGVAIALTFVYLTHRLRMPALDGVGAICVGVLMIAVASFLIYEVQKLLVGERALPEQLEQIQQLIEADPAVASTEKPRTMHFGPDTLLAAVRVQFKPDGRGDADGANGQPDHDHAADIPAAIDRLHHTVRQRLPVVKYLYIEPQRVGERPEPTPRE